MTRHRTNLLAFTFLVSFSFAVQADETLIDFSGTTQTPETTEASVPIEPTEPTTFFGSLFGATEPIPDPEEEVIVEIQARNHGLTRANSRRHASARGLERSNKTPGGHRQRDDGNDANEDTSDSGSSDSDSSDGDAGNDHGGNGGNSGGGNGNGGGNSGGNSGRGNGHN
ncbi:MAG: hypothetical protein JKY49_14320 [Cohaesibacteraceae bacterium]|nr:hypothetical protein [Cohaesibacteraceae bacterium]